MNSSGTSSPRGATAFGVFLFFAAVTASLAGITLLFPGIALERMWLLNPRAHQELAPLGRMVGIPFLFLGAVLAVAGVGWFKRRLWGWKLAVAVIAVQVLGDLVNVFMGRVVEGGIGVAIAGALLWYLLHAKVRAVFERRA